MFVTAAHGDKSAIMAEAAICYWLMAALVMPRDDLLPILSYNQIAIDCTSCYDEAAFFEGQ